MVRAWARVREPGCQVPPAANKPGTLGQNAQLGATLSLHLLDCGRGCGLEGPLDPLTFSTILRLIDLALLTLLKPRGRGGGCVLASTA